MNISLSPIKQNNLMFRATQNAGTQKNVEKKEKPLLPQQALEKRTKIAIGSCLAVVAVLNVLYFFMKRSYKYHKINLKEIAEKKAERIKKPLSLEELQKQAEQA